MTRSFKSRRNGIRTLFFIAFLAALTIFRKAVFLAGFLGL